MRGVRVTEAGVQVADVPPPEPGPDDVVVKVAASGICGSDLHLLSWGPLPVILGHEVAGWLPDGTAVAIEPVRWCGTCERCLAGDSQLCATASTIGISVDGGMADEVLVGPECVVPLPAGLDVLDAGLVEPVACAVHAMARARVEPGMRVAVVGGGTLGIAAVAAATHLGCEVGAVTRHPHQAEAAEAVGGRPAEGPHDVVIEAAGTSSAFAAACDLARARGTIALLGTYWEDLTAPGIPLTIKELDVVACYGYGHHGGRREVEDAAALLAAVPALAPALVTHRFGLDDAAEAFRVAADRASGAIKVVLQP